MKKILCYSMLLCFLSCNEHTLKSDELSIERETFITGKNVNEQKEKFMSLPFQQRRDIWIGKINQIITVKGMSEQHYVIMSSILDIFKNAENENTLFNNSQLEDLAVSLAEITPQADYIEMFEKLGIMSSQASKLLRQTET